VASISRPSKIRGVRDGGREPDTGQPKDESYFRCGLRSILRQDPNVILVGEIRDEETASIAISSAMTGHLVLSTIHANDAAAAIPVCST